MTYEVKADTLETSFDAVDHPPIAVSKPVVIPTARPALSGIKTNEKSPEVKAFVDQYLRKGIAQGVGLKSIDSVALGDGGFAIPLLLDAQIDHILKAISPIRQIANVVKVGNSGYRKLITLGGTNSGWGAEIGTRTQTNTATFQEIAPPMGDLYANPAATQLMLDDAYFNVEAWLTEEIAREFARAEGSAFVNGTGINQPAGFLTAPVANTADNVRPFGTMQYIATGVDSAFPATTPENTLFNLVNALRPPYRQGAVWVMNATVMNLIRMFRTTQGNYLWAPSLADGRPDMLLGYPVYDAEDMPNIASGSLSIAFGNFQAGYIITDRQETNILRDPFTNKPFVNFYAHKRLGGAVVNSEAIKFLKFGVS